MIYEIKKLKKMQVEHTTTTLLTAETSEKKSSMAATVACALVSHMRESKKKDRPSVRMESKANDYSNHSKQLK